MLLSSPVGRGRVECRLHGDTARFGLLRPEALATRAAMWDFMATSLSLSFMCQVSRIRLVVIVALKFSVVNATIIIFAFVLYCIVLYCILRFMMN